MKKVSKTTLKAKMFEYFRDLEESGEELIITDFGKPVLKVIPYQESKTIDELFSGLRNKAKISRQAALQSTEDEWNEK
jgi:antitoxin (DNA-binding transcriptional repressor) of toxin-antitoxin stability system